MKPQADPNHYFKPSYDTKGRFISYWHQINEVIKLKPNSILEVGIGNGFVANYLKQRGYNIVTLDINPKLNPMVVGSILNLPFCNEAFEVVTCFQVLEHLPYKLFSKAVSEIHRVSRNHAILSLPDITRAYRFLIQIPKIGEFKKLISLTRFNPQKLKIGREHCWEIGMTEFPLRRILKDIKEIGFKVIETYRVFENPYHRFFILKK